MCTVLLAWRCLPDHPVVLAANRDELVVRPSEGPRLLAASPRVAGGRDAMAGGTWLAVREDGAVAAVTNRRAERRDPDRRSRGELPLRLLEGRTDSALLQGLRAIRPSDYNPVNALVATPTVAAVAHGEGARVRVAQLAPGAHVLTTVDVDDRGWVKVAWLASRLEAAVARSAGPDQLLAAMQELLRDHGEPGRDGLAAPCIHGEVYGTVSSSTVAVGGDGIRYRHAPGRPCTTAYEDVSALLRPASTP